MDCYAVSTKTSAFPQGAPKLAWPISVVSCWRKEGGGEILSSVSIQSLDVGYPLEEVTLGEATLF